MFGPRSLRIVGCAGIILLQLMILGTGNYTFFNLLAIALALLLLDDVCWSQVLPQRVIRLVTGPATEGYVPLPVRLSLTLAALALLALSVASFTRSLAPRDSGSGGALGWLEPFRSVNGYGLFRVMTTSRNEIVVEGSDDGAHWREYEFRYKPGDVARRPRFVEPHQPRLDWQMWFAALSPFEDTPWFQRFLARLLRGSPPVLGLLRTNPFPDHPPKYVRALLYSYHFTTRPERQMTGAWWRRDLLGAYSPVLSLRE
jgi:hypothetical protein